MKSRAVVLTLVVTLAACLIMTGIASANTVGIVMPTKSLERWNRYGEYLKNQFEAKGYDVSIRYSDNKMNSKSKTLKALSQTTLTFSSSFQSMAIHSLRSCVMQRAKFP